MATLSQIQVVGVHRLRYKLAMGKRAGVQDVAQTLYREAERIMALAKSEYVPVVTGALRSSGHVQKPKFLGSTVTVTLGFGGASASYALEVHENPRAGKTYGMSPSGFPYPPGTWSKVGQWKFLTEPVTLSLPRVKAQLHKTLVRGLKRA